jgi:hypothetical protein
MTQHLHRVQKMDMIQQMHRERKILYRDPVTALDTRHLQDTADTQDTSNVQDTAMQGTQYTHSIWGRGRDGEG